ncbi:MAG: putative DNA binding domain-containing protein [Caldilineales bacterium]
MTIRPTPFVFLKRVAVVTLVFAFLPVILALVFGVEREYQASGLARVVPSFALLLVLVLAFVQFVIVVTLFASWYFTSYKVTAQEIVHRRASFGGATSIVKTPQITGIDIHFGPLGKRLDYGDLIITSVDQATARLKNVPNPAQYVERIEDLATQALRSGQMPTWGSARELIALGENNQVEFKASLLWDYRREAVNKDLYEPVMKTLAAFMNTAGGLLLIGVSDDGQPLGIERDYTGLPKKNPDGWENAFNMAFNQLIGAELRHNLELVFEEIDSVLVAVALARPSPIPCYLTFKGREEFYIRTGNSSQSLTVSRATRYIQTRFTA